MPRRLHLQHHYHFGYYLYGAAAVGKANATWLAANKDLLMNLVRDFANPRKGARLQQHAGHMGGGHAAAPGRRGQGTGGGWCHGPVPHTVALSCVALNFKP